MSWIRTELEQALQELLLEVAHTAHFYQALGSLYAEESWGADFKQFVQEREALAAELEKAVKSEGDLPAAPDPDSEALQLWVQELEVLVSEDHQRKVLEEAAGIESKLLTCLGQAQQTDKAHLHGNVLRMVRDSCTRIQKRLSELGGV